MARSGQVAEEVIAMKRTAIKDRTPQTPAKPPNREGATPRALPRVVIEGQLYFRDERLQEYRAVADPCDRIPFEVMAWAVAILGRWPD
jgi:hypothetical protein